MPTRQPAQPIELYCFASYFELPFASCAPFPAKLETWLRLAELPFRVVIENDPRKGPKGKSPWIVDGDVHMGDSELIIAHLSERYGVELDAHLDGRARAEGLVIRRTFEEHFHQIWEHFSFVHPEGWVRGKQYFLDVLGPLQGRIVGPLMRRSLRAQLHARGVTRHVHEEIVRMGIDDLEAVATLLGERPFFGGDAPATVDATAFAFLALTIDWPEVSPVHRAARENARLVAYCDRMRARVF